MSDDCVTVGITGLGAGESPSLRICVPLDDRGATALKIIEALYGNEEGLAAAVARFKSYAAVTP